MTFGETLKRLRQRNNISQDELAEKVYKTYFVVRGDNDYAYAHKEYLQNIALQYEQHML